MAGWLNWLGFERKMDNSTFPIDNPDEKQSPSRPQDNGTEKLTWNMFFVLACAVAVSLDPFFFYIPTIDQKKKCVLSDKTLTIFAVISRLVIDITYVVDIIYILIDKNCASPVTKKLRPIHILLDLLAIIPVPQVVIVVLFPKLRGSRALHIRKYLNLILLSQYVPKVLRLYFSSKEHSDQTSDLLTGRTNSACVKGVFNFFLYILASHVFGAFWYFFSFQRLTSCWQNACSKHSRLCKFDHGRFYGNITFLESSCPTKVDPPNSTPVFDFGIFLPAIQSGLLESYDFPQKLFYCVWWGLQNLSSSGQNLQTSTYVWENILAVCISVSGLLLFLYLIGNLQTYLQSATTRTEKIRHKMKKLNIVSWIEKSNDLTHEEKPEIIQKLKQELRKNKDVDKEALLSILSREDKTIKDQLCLPLLTKIPAIESLDLNEQKLKAICKHLKLVFYDESSFMIREGEPLDRMILIKEGTALSYSDGSFNGISNSNIRLLGEGNYLGEELLRINWPPTSTNSCIKIPISTTNLKSHTKVYAFVLMATDLKKLVLTNFG